MAVAGSRSAITVIAGSPTLRSTTEHGGHTPMVIGPTLMTDGLGFPTKILAGPLITMAVGSDWRITGGSGSPVTNGVRLGYRGVQAATTLVGRRYRPRPKPFTKVGR